MEIEKILNNKENFLGATMFDRMDQWNIPGVSFTIIHNNVKKYSKPYSGIKYSWFSRI